MANATQPHERTAETTVRTPGGILVYDQLGQGTRQLVGFRDVQDWEQLSRAVKARGHGSGHALHLPELEEAN